MLTTVIYISDILNKIRTNQKRTTIIMTSLLNKLQQKEMIFR